MHVEGLIAASMSFQHNGQTVNLETADMLTYQ
jgi:hypothetical protein